MKNLPILVSLLVLLALNLIPPLLLPQLSFNNAPEIYLPDDQASVILEQQLRQQFPDDQVAIVLFKGEALYSDDFLQTLQQAARDIKQLEQIERVINVTEIEHISGSEDGFEVTPLLGDRARNKYSDAQERFIFARSDRVAQGSVVSDSAQYMGMIIRPYAMDSTLARIRIVDSVTQILQHYQLHSYVAGMAGPIPIEIEQFKSMLNDTMMFVPGTMLIGLTLIWLMFKRLLAVLVAGFVTGAVVNGTVLLFVIFDAPYTLVASMIPPLLAALTTALLVHLFNNIQLAASFAYVAEQRVQFALAEIRKPAFFTALTTAVGLCSLGLSPIPPISHFGLIASAGVMLLLLLVLYAVPVLLIRFDQQAWPKPRNKQAMIDRLLKFSIHLSIRHAKWVLMGMAGLLMAGIPQILSVTAETNMLKFFKEQHIISTSTTMIEAQLTGVMPLEVDLYVHQRDGFKQAESLKQVKMVQDWLKQQSEVDKVNSVVDIVEEMHKGFHADQEQYRRIPDDSRLISQYFFTYDGTEMYELINREFDQARIVISMNEHNSQRIRQFIARINDYLKAHIQKLTWDVGGEGRIFADQDALLIQGQIVSLMMAVLLIFLMMFWLWKNLSHALLTMLPNLSPIVGIFILMGLLNIWLDMATAMIASVSIGIAVDDTIHLFHGFKKRMDQGGSTVFALAQSCYKTGRAIVVTSIILCSQFLLLSFSQFIPTAHFGLLTAIGLFMALLFDLFLLPAMIIAFYKKAR